MSNFGILAMAQQAISKHLQPGDLAVDATVGNGHDTLFLAQQVGKSGHVFGLDIQRMAIERTRQRLCEHKQQEQVTLIQMSHHQLDQALPANIKGQLRAIMFNLGYLPHGDHQLITQADTTLLACQIASQWLSANGLISIVLYTGHPGGEEEAQQVLQWARSLPTRQFQVLWQQVLGRKQAPSLLLIHKQHL
jgi:hypothetical protein